MASIDDDENGLLDELARTFLSAIDHQANGRVDEAEDLLRDLVRREPRLPEPHLELARLLLDTDRVSEAEEHAREAVRYLEEGGQWTEDLPENVLMALAYATLGEALRRRADEDDVIFGDPKQFRAIVDEARSLFERANNLDPSDEYSSYHAFFLGIPGKNGIEGIDDGDVSLLPDPEQPFLLGSEPGEA